MRVNGWTEFFARTLIWVVDIPGIINGGLILAIEERAVALASIARSSSLHLKAFFSIIYPAAPKNRNCCRLVGRYREQYNLPPPTAGVG
jgi:hypothetical protein